MREVKRGYWNLPGDGPVTPRLRQIGLKDAIGFKSVDPPVLLPEGWDMRPGAMNVMFRK